MNFVHGLRLTLQYSKTEINNQIRHQDKDEQRIFTIQAYHYTKAFGQFNKTLKLYIITHYQYNKKTTNIGIDIYNRHQKGGSKLKDQTTIYLSKEDRRQAEKLMDLYELNAMGKLIRVLIQSEYNKYLAIENNK